MAINPNKPSSGGNLSEKGRGLAGGGLAALAYIEAVVAGVDFTERPVASTARTAVAIGSLTLSRKLRD